MNQGIRFIFGAIFLCLSGFHFYQSAQSIKKPENKAKISAINGLNIGIKEFINDFGDYINKLNKQNKTINIIAALGYLIACGTSLFSYYLSLPH